MSRLTGFGVDYTNLITITVPMKFSIMISAHEIIDYDYSVHEIIDYDYSVA